MNEETKPMKMQVTGTQVGAVTDKVITADDAMPSAPEVTSEMAQRVKAKANILRAIFGPGYRARMKAKMERDARKAVGREERIAAAAVKRDRKNAKRRGEAIGGRAGWITDEQYAERAARYVEVHARVDAHNAMRAEQRAATA